MKFEDTEIYKAGEFFLTLGAILQDPNSTLEDLTWYCRKHGREFQFGLTQIEEAE